MAVLADAGCTTTRQATRPDGPVEHVQMEPMQVIARRTPHGTVIETRDAMSLFRAGGDAFQDGRYAEAAAAYSVLLAEFPASTYSDAARYNLGLALEKAGRIAEAITAFQQVVAHGADPKDAIDATFRIAGCYEALKDWERVEQTLHGLRERQDLTDENRVEADVRLGMAYLHRDQLDEAEARFRAVLRRNKTGPPRPLLPSDRFLAQAQYGVSRVEHRRFSLRSIRLPQELMDQDVQEKARTFLRAQAAYLRAMGYKDRYWSSASGLKVGALYEDFYNDLMTAPVPKELNAEEVEVYFEELRKVIRPLVERAIYVYEKNARLAEGLGPESEVLQETRDRLERLRKFVDPKDEEPPAAPPQTSPEAPGTG